MGTGTMDPSAMSIPLIRGYVIKKKKKKKKKNKITICKHGIIKQQELQSTAPIAPHHLSTYTDIRYLTKPKIWVLEGNFFSIL